MFGLPSVWMYTTDSVPQGYLLGPILFLLLISEIVYIVSSICPFASDTCLYIVVDSDITIELPNADFKKITEWDSKWNIRCNPLKQISVNLMENFYCCFKDAQ